MVAIGRFTEPGPGSVNTFWIEGEAGIVVIDGQREISKARMAREMIAATGKPIVAAFITHPHPDHFGGIGEFVGEDVPVYASAQTRGSMAEDRFGLIKASREAVKDDFPAIVTLPTAELTDGQTLDLVDTRIVVHELGPGEAECMTALHLPDHNVLFPADALQDRMTAYLLEGRSDAWLKQLDDIERCFPSTTTIYPGHGEPGPLAELVDRQRDYLRRFRAAVENEGEDAASDTGAKRVAAAIEKDYPSYVPVAAIPTLLEMNVKPVHDEMSA